MFHKITPKQPGLNRTFRGPTGNVFLCGEGTINSGNGLFSPASGLNAWAATAIGVAAMAPLVVVSNNKLYGAAGQAPCALFVGTSTQGDGYIGFANTNSTAYLGGMGGGTLITGQNVNDLSIWSDQNQINFAGDNGTQIRFQVASITGANAKNYCAAIFNDHANGRGLEFFDTNASPGHFDIGLGIGTGSVGRLEIYDRTNGAGVFTFHQSTSSEILSVGASSAAGGSFLSWRESGVTGTEVGFMGNGTSVGGAGATDFGIGCDSGSLKLSGSTNIDFRVGGASVAQLVKVATNGTGTPTFGANKPTASSASVGWLQFTIGGVTRYIPFWA